MPMILTPLTIFLSTDKYTGLFDACFPFKTIKAKALNSFTKPLLTKNLLRSINKKNKLYKQYLRHRSNEKLLKYKTYKNKLTDLLRVAKSIYSVQVSSFMYLYHNDALPISFTQIFQTGNQIHQYLTRYSDFYRPHTCRTNIKKNFDSVSRS